MAAKNHDSNDGTKGMIKNGLISIVIPVYNEENILETSIKEIFQCTESTAPEYEIVVVDDGSDDDTWEVISSLSDKNRRIKGIRLSKNFGKEAAIFTGLEFAAGDAVIVMDGDLQHPPELIPKMVEIWLQGNAEIVEAVKESRGQESMLTTIRARAFYALVKLLSGLPLKNSSDFKLLDRKVVDTYRQLPERTRFFRGIVAWLGFRKVQIPFTVRERSRGESGWSFGKLIRLAIDAATAFSTIPLHFITLLGLMTLIFSAILGVQTLYMKITGQAVSGFTTVILLLLFIGSVLMLSLGIIGIYIGRIFEEVKRRPIFIVKQTRNINNFSRRPRSTN